MPSWNEKPHTTPTINVNLKPCDCDTRTHRTTAPFLTSHHDSKCSGTPILIPCPIPRSVTFEVVLGRCECAAQYRGVTGFGVSEPQGKHTERCPANPVKVSCSIGGETWAESEVTGVEVDHALPWPFPPLLEIANERWALVKALVLGLPSHAAFLGETVPTFTARTKAIKLRNHRDAVFAALAKVATMERSIFEAQGEYTSAMYEHPRADWHRDPESYEMPSQKMLALYVELLIEQVGALQ